MKYRYGLSQHNILCNYVSGFLHKASKEEIEFLLFLDILEVL